MASSVFTRNVNARVFTNQIWTDGRRTKTDPKTSAEHSSIFQLVRDINKTKKIGPPPWRPYINETNVFMMIWHKIVTSRVHVFQRTGTIFELNSLLTMKTASPTGGHVCQRTGTTFKLNQHIIKTNILTNYMTIGHEIFILDQDIIGTNLLTSQITKTAPPTCGNVFQRTGTTFEHNQHIIKTTIFTNFKLDRGIIRTRLLTKFHEDRTRNVASRVFTRFICGQIRKTAPPTGGHVFQQTGITFELNQHIIKTNILTKKLFKSFELDRGIIDTKLMTKFHEDRTRNMASRVFTNKFGPTDKDRSQRLS
ncbi:hypothetical protein DPMN_169728 [Dreissena polymorpha]|uniref:Uncharacterized protein n=1 Tax=Dreissena polymorpha TaxID=45954 RepID=A0A9D4ICI7_DREPO|nr:hypothetical protein DPMN_169728 [Dreissena polymorpha]